MERVTVTLACGKRLRLRERGKRGLYELVAPVARYVKRIVETADPLNVS